VFLDEELKRVIALKGAKAEEGKTYIMKIVTTCTLLYILRD
jgi:hypothetical protein